MTSVIAQPNTLQPRQTSAAYQAFASYLDTQIDQILDGDAGLRRGDDPIHDTRVAIRRLRSTFRVLPGGIDSEPVRAMATDLRWFAGLLGAVRDCQVQVRRFAVALDALPDVLVLGPVRARIRDDLRAAELSARARVTEAMDTPRYRDMLADILRWRDDPPVRSDLKTAPLDASAERAYRKADRRLAAALRSTDDALLHRARKATKRARYAAELLGTASGKKSPKRRVKQYKNIQDVLGDHQDTVVATEFLRQMGAAAGTTAGENGFTFGLLYAREEQIARECRGAVSHLR